MYKKILDFLDFLGQALKKILNLSLSVVLLIIIIFYLKSCFFDSESYTFSSTKHHDSGEIELKKNKKSKCKTDIVVMKNGKIIHEKHTTC